LSSPSIFRRRFFAAGGPARLAALAAMAWGLAAGCGGEPGPPPRPLRIALSRPPSGYDPHLLADLTARSVFDQIYQPLVRLDGQMRPVPALAANWENPEPRRWRLHLDSGARFSDGRPLEMADVLFSLDRARHHPRSRQSGALVAIEAIRPLDSRSFEIETFHPYPILLNKLSLVAIVPAGSPDEITEPVGTGPYRLVKKTAAVAELEAWPAAGASPPPGHSAVEPGQARRVSFHFVPDGAERARGLREGRFDLVAELPPAAVPEIEALADLRVASLSSYSVTYLQLPHGRPPFADRRLRRAIDLLLDRELLVAGMAGGYGAAVGQLVSANVTGFNPDLQPTPRDLEAARRLLAEAGYGGGLEIAIEFPEGWDISSLVGQLAAGGVRATPRPQPWPQLYQRLLAGQTEVYLGHWTCTSGDASSLLDRLLHTPDPARGWGDINFSRYSNGRIDVLAERSQQENDPIARRAMLQEAIALAAEDLAMVPLYSADYLYGLRRNLNWTPRRDGRILVQEARWR
jgi:peptide/nickel transport system substrate-binding protein